MNERTDFWEYIKDVAGETGSLFLMNKADRANLFDFFDINEWFGTGLAPGQMNFINGSLQIQLDHEVISSIDERLRLWMSAYKKSNEEKYSLLIRYAGNLWPDTTAEYDRMILSKNNKDKAEAWQLLDFFLCELTKELDQYGADELDELITKAAYVLTSEQGKLFSAFWDNLKRKTDNCSALAFRFQRQGRSRGAKEAYTKDAFSRMAYLIFNPASWEENRLVEKACDREVHANIWAFISMHFVCGIRDVDILKLPKPSLPYEGRRFREKVMAGEVTEFRNYAREMRYRLEMSPYLPQKTGRASSIPEVKVFIPDSLEAPMGMILSIAASYRDDVRPGNGFIRADRRIAHIDGFFGRDFSELLGHKNFVSQSANKAYLQGLEMTGDQEEGIRSKGYIIAALARSHKGSIASMPDSTEAYLKDAKFSGYGAEEAAWEMTQRGVFGFIPHVLLETCYGSDYTRLSVSAQTKVIQELGMKPVVIETIVRIKEKGMAEAKKAVSEMVRGADVRKVIDRIAGGKAGARNPDAMCLMTASGKTCRFPESSACVGCRYEVHTKAGLHLLVKDYARMRRLMQDGDGWRYRAIARDIIMPVMAEYVSTVRGHVGADEKVICAIMERGLDEDADGNSSR